MKSTIKLYSDTYEYGQELKFKKLATTFKRELKKLLIGLGCDKVELNTNYFYVSGFFTAPSGQIWYIYLHDVRYKIGKPLMYRTATSYKDFTGGYNQFCTLDSLEATFKSRIH